MNKTLRYLSLCLSVLLLPACSLEQVTISNPVTIEADESCIDSFDNFAFSTPDIDADTQKVILPIEPWQVEVELPEESRLGNYQIAALRYIDDNTEVWLQLYEPGGVYEEKDAVAYHFLVYNTSSRSWKKVPARIEGTIIFVDRLFVAKDGSLWGRNVWAHEVEISGNPALSRYDEVENRFEFDLGTSSIPNGLLDPKRMSTRFPIWNAILLDPNDIFWFFSYRDAIYSYEPKTQQMLRHASLENTHMIGGVTLSSDGSIYIRNLDPSAESVKLENGQIYQYFPSTEEIVPLRLPNIRWPATNSILADKTGRLWIGAFGWIEPGGEWKVFHPQMGKFLRINEYFSLWKYYRPPSVFMESSDGKLWFNIPRSEEWKTLRSGIAWYDPHTNEGCWFTTEGFNVGEDANRIIWLTAKGILYRYLLNP